MKIAWFTPYHAHSAIGHYSQRVVSELRKEDEVVVYTPAGSAGTEPRPDGGAVEAVGNGPYESLLGRLRAYDVVVYNMGNDYHNHKMVYEVSIRHPGIVVLHDLVLRDFFYGYHYLPHRDVDGLGRHVLYNEGPTATAMQWVSRQKRRLPILHTPDGLQFPMFKSALRRCLGVIVHSQFSRERVAAASSAPVVTLDFPPFGPCVTHAHETTPRPTQSRGRLQLLTFGILNSNKLIHKVIELIGRSPYLRDNVFYTIIGEGQKSYEQQLRDLIKSHDLSQVVHLAGRLSDRELWRRLTQADLVVNLRNPHMGESSATLLNALFAGAAIIVWNHGCYAEFPDDVVHKVSSDEDLALALEQLCRDRPLLQRMGAKRIRHAAERFDISTFCRRFREFTTEVRSARPILELTDLLSDRLLEFGERPPDELVERVAEEVAALAGTAARKTTSLAA